MCRTLNVAGVVVYSITQMQRLLLFLYHPVIAASSELSMYMEAGKNSRSTCADMIHAIHAVMATIAEERHRFTHFSAILKISSGVVVSGKSSSGKSARVYRECLFVACLNKSRDKKEEDG